QAAGHAAGQHLDQHRLHRRDRLDRDVLATVTAFAVQRADYLTVPVQDRGRYHELDVQQTLRWYYPRLVGGQPGGALLGAHAVEDGPARRRAGIDDDAGGGAHGDRLPAALLQQQYPAGVEPDDVHHGLGGPLEKIRRAGRRLENGHRTFQPAHQVVQLDLI